MFYSDSGDILFLFFNTYIRNICNASTATACFLSTMSRHCVTWRKHLPYEINTPLSNNAL